MIDHRGHKAANAAGFTLIELLVVIAIIGILATILIPTLATARQRATSTRCESLLKDMARGQQLWMDDNDGRFIRTGYTQTRGTPWPVNLQRYLSATSFLCAAYQTTSWGNTTYGYWGYYRTSPTSYFGDNVPDSACYKSAEFSQPGKAPLFLDWDGALYAVYVDYYWSSRIATVAPIALRHLGAMNVVYLDGHVGYKKDTIKDTISHTNGF